jgi:two-component system chemotaxis sensor kinase CheA
MPEMSDDFKEIIENFLVETNELIEKLGNDFIQLEKSGDSEVVHEVFRTVHSIKGTAGFLGFNNMQKVSHGMEDILNKLRHDEMKLNESIIDVLYLGLDHLQIIVTDVKADEPDKTNIDDVISKLSKILAGEKVVIEREASDETVVEESEEKVILEDEFDDINDGMQEIIDSFIIETEEILEELDQDLIKFEKRLVEKINGSELIHARKEVINKGSDLYKLKDANYLINLSFLAFTLLNV